MQLIDVDPQWKMKLYNVKEAEIGLDGVVDAKVEIRKKEYSLVNP